MFRWVQECIPFLKTKRGKVHTCLDCMLYMWFYLFGDCIDLVCKANSRVFLVQIDNTPVDNEYNLYHCKNQIFPCIFLLRILYTIIAKTRLVLRCRILPYTMYIQLNHLNLRPNSKSHTNMVRNALL